MRSPGRAMRSVPALCVAIVATLVTMAPVAAVAPPQPADGLTMGRGLSVQAPAPGFGVAASALLVDGDHVDLVLETDSDGITRRVDEPTVAAAAVDARSAGGGDACSDRSYKLLSIKWHSAWNWRFNAGSTPRDLQKAVVERHLRAAVGSITGARNRCGMPDQVNARSSYRGRTSVRPNININGCRSRDGRSVVGFGRLPDGVLGLTCTTYQIVPGVDRSVESDVLFNKADFRWATKVNGCFDRPVLRSVAAHEFGHVFGLDHPDGNHGSLTMNESVGSCDDSGFRLGRGDVLGLQRRY